MCYFDAEPCTVYQRHWATIRKPRPCDVCGWFMPKGAPYRHHSWLFDGSWDSSDVCFACEALLHEFRESHGSWPSPDWFVDAIHSCYEDSSFRHSGRWLRNNARALGQPFRALPQRLAFKIDPDAQHWRDAHAAILRRGRSARPVTAQVAHG